MQTGFLGRWRRSASRLSRCGLAAGGCLLIGGLVLGLAGGAQASEGALPAAGPSAITTTASATPALATHAAVNALVVPGLSPSSTLGSTDAPPATFHGKQVDIESLSALGADDIWATGVSQELTPLVLHWNGRRWSTTTLGSHDTGLDAITALSPTNVWAVGFDYATDGTALIEHYDGTSWTRSDAPTEPDTVFVLSRVGFITPDDGYAFGEIGSELQTPQHSGRQQDGTDQPDWDGFVTLHWDGTSWTQVQTDGNEFEALSASSPTDAWMVGRSADGTSITQHWDGSVWTVVPSPSRGNDNDLLSVTDISPDNVWAAGNAYEHGTYSLHWTGTKWKLISDAAQRPADLMDIDGTSSHNVWISGIQGVTQGLLEHWDGHTWASTETGTTGLTQPQIQAVATISPNDTWAVGEYFFFKGQRSYSRRLILHWDGTSWTRFQE